MFSHLLPLWYSIAFFLIPGTIIDSSDLYGFIATLDVIQWYCSSVLPSSVLPLFCTELFGVFADCHVSESFNLASFSVANDIVFTISWPQYCSAITGSILHRYIKFTLSPFLSVAPLLSLKLNVTLFPSIAVEMFIFVTSFPAVDGEPWFVFEAVAQLLSDVPQLYPWFQFPI